MPKNEKITAATPTSEESLGVVVFSDSFLISLQNLIELNQSRKVEELERYGGLEQLASSLLTDLRNGIPAEEQENDFAARTEKYKYFNQKYCRAKPPSPFCIFTFLSLFSVPTRDSPS